MLITDLHNFVWDRLQRLRQQLPHALLFTGQSGIGKYELVKHFANALLCERTTESGEACGCCAACGWLALGNHPDFRLLQPEALSESEVEGETGSKKKASQQITIDQVRALDDFLHVGTHRHGIRVILINPAEAMNRSTANSLLKSLEEPLPGTLFLLVSSEPERLLPTIRSRCQVLTVGTPDLGCAQAWLRHQGIKDADRWLVLAGGAPLRAQELGTSGESTLIDGLVTVLTLGSRLVPVSAAVSMDQIVKAEKRQAPLKRIVEWAQKWIYDLTLVSQSLPPRYFVSDTAVLERLVKTTNTLRLLALGKKTLQYRMQCEQPLNSRLFLEDFFMTYAATFTSSRGGHG